VIGGILLKEGLELQGMVFLDASVEEPELPICP
jgi:hypothetical protein